MIVKQAAQWLFVAGATYGSNRFFLDGIRERGWAFVMEVRPSEVDSFEEMRAAAVGLTLGGSSAQRCGGRLSLSHR